MRDFKHSMDVLIKAYLNDTLEHENCYACAVGNLVAEAMGIKVVRYAELTRLDTLSCGWDKMTIPHWYDAIAYSSHDESSVFGGLQIKSTGYTHEEVGRIEYAFETADRGHSCDDWMFNGLVAVLDVLADIHAVEAVAKESYHEQLVSVYETR